MGKVRVNIDGTDADIFDSRDFPLKLDFQIESINDFSSRKGSGSSQTYKLPGTPTNQKIFGLFDQYSSIPIDDIKTTRPCTISIDDVPLLTGKVVLINTTTVSNWASRRAFDFEVAFISSNSDWFNDFEGLTLQDIDWSDLDHELTAANIEAGWPFGGVSNQYAYSLYKWKDWINPNYVTHVEFTPELYATEILTRAFNLIGYTIDSTFITQTPFTGLVHPVPLRQYGADFFAAKTNLRATKTTTNAGLSAPGGLIIYDDDTTAPNSDPGGNYNNVTGIYTAPYTGFYKARATVTITAITDPLSKFWLQFAVNAVPFQPWDLVNYTIVNGDTMVYEQVIQMNQGDQLQVNLLKPAGGGTYTTNAGEFTVEMTEHTWVLNESDVFFDFLVPAWSLNDYIRGLTEMFNLYIFADSAAKTVRIESRDFPNVSRFIDGQRDISQEIDLSKRGAKRFVTADKNIRYCYKDDSNDDTVTAMNDTEAINMFCSQYVLSDPNATGTEEIQNSFFAPTIHIKDNTIAGFANLDTPPQIPFIWPENYFETPSGVTPDYVFAPRILYHLGIVAAPAGGEPSQEGTISLNTSFKTFRNRWPKSFMVDYDDFNGNRPNLSYSNEIVGFGLESKGLVRTYYINQLASINNGVQRDEWWLAKLTDIINEQFRDKILIRGVRYILQKISNYTPTRQESTKIVLLEDVCAEQDDVDRLVPTNKKGLINE
jgi:hypothetical protein